MSSYHKSYSKTACLVLCGLFAALTAICSYITIPLPFTPIPMNLGMLGVFLSGGLLGKKYGSLSVAVYIIMGIAGIPVFAGFQAGFSILAGPTGGYIWGYLVAVFVIGLTLESFPKHTASPAKRSKTLALCMGAMALGTIICYILGTAWFMILMDTGPIPSITMCVLPFIPGDLVKIIVGAFLIQRLRPLI